jgi:hypothetical protein
MLVPRDVHGRRHYGARHGCGFTEPAETSYWSSSAGSRAFTLLAGDTEEVEAAFDVRDDLVDLAHRALAGSIDRPDGKEVAESVELDYCPEKVDGLGFDTR